MEITKYTLLLSSSQITLLPAKGPTIAPYSSRIPTFLSILQQASPSSSYAFLPYKKILLSYFSCLLPRSNFLARVIIDCLPILTCFSIVLQGLYLFLLSFCSLYLSLSLSPKLARTFNFHISEVITWIFHVFQNWVNCFVFSSIFCQYFVSIWFRLVSISLYSPTFFFRLFLFCCLFKEIIWQTQCLFCIGSSLKQHLIFSLESIVAESNLVASNSH